MSEVPLYTCQAASNRATFAQCTAVCPLKPPQKGVTGQNTFNEWICTQTCFDQRAPFRLTPPSKPKSQPPMAVLPTHHRATSLMNPPPPPRTTIGSKASSHCRVLGLGRFLMSEVPLYRILEPMDQEEQQQGGTPFQRGFQSSRTSGAAS